MTLSWSWRMFRSSCCMPERRPSAAGPVTRRLIWLNIAWVMTSSPTVLISSSTFSTPTRIDPASGAAMKCAGSIGVATEGVSVGTATATDLTASTAAVAAAGVLSPAVSVSSQSAFSHSQTSRIAVSGALLTRHSDQLR